MSRVKMLLLFSLTVFAPLSVPRLSSAGEMDALLGLLAEKGILAPGEARGISAAAERPLGRSPELSGDVRLRYQFNDNGNLAERRHRGRVRLRLFAAAAPAERVRAGFGLASGESTDPRSANQTFTGNGAKKDLYIDRVFAEYRVSRSLSVSAGRDRNPLWLTSDLLWDGDINPEGINLRAAGDCGRGLELFLRSGLVILGESQASSGDPHLLYAQPGFGWRGPGGRFDMKAGAAFYAFSHVKGSAAFPYRPSAADYQQANTLVSSVYRYDYDAVAPELELNWNFADPVPLPLPGCAGCKAAYIGLFGSAVKSLSRSGSGSGWLAGLKAGRRKVAAGGQWQLRYSYRRLEADAWPDTYPDSDFYGGSTNVKGHEAGLAVGLADGVSLDFDYYRAGPVNGPLKKESLFQADVNISF